MRAYYYLDAARRPIGPCTGDEIGRLLQLGVLNLDTEVREATEVAWTFLRELRLTSPGTAAPPPLPTSTDKATAAHSMAPPPVIHAASSNAPSINLVDKVTSDLQTLRPFLLAPFAELRRFGWIENRKLLGLATVGLLPLAFLQLFDHDIHLLFWSLALYFSALWALFFRWIFNATEVTNRECITCFVTTAIVGIGFVLTVQQLPPWTWLYSQTGADVPGLGFRMVGYIGGVGLAEEFGKALVLFYMVNRTPRPTPQTMLVFGLMSGLGFGIREGIHYQEGHNLAVSINGLLNALTQPGAKPADAAPMLAHYYIHNLARLTSLPFIHAVFSAIAGYFIGMAALHRGHRHGLWVAAIAIPAVLHGTYDTFSDGIVGLAITFVSVVALVLYLNQSRDLDTALADRSMALHRPPRSATCSLALSRRER